MKTWIFNRMYERDILNDIQIGDIIVNYFDNNETVLSKEIDTRLIYTDKQIYEVLDAINESVLVIYYTI